jgi:hypothetical protein
VLLRVRGGKDTIERGDKLRCSRLTILGVCSEDEVREAVHVMSQLFGEHADAMAESQMKWRRALARPYCDESAVEAGLRAALDARGLSEWKLRQFAAACEVRDRAWAARDAWATRAARDAWDAWDAWATRAMRDVWGAWYARATRDVWGACAARKTWDHLGAQDAESALTVQFAALMGETDHDPMLLTEGLRDAYGHGLSVAVPVGPRTLGWAMVEKGS